MDIRLPFRRVVKAAGLDPDIFAITPELQTTKRPASREAKQAVVFSVLIQWLGRESNPRHADFQRSCLHDTRITLWGQQIKMYRLRGPVTVTDRLRSVAESRPVTRV